MHLSLLSAVGGNEQISWTPYVEMDNDSFPMYYVIYKQQLDSSFQRLDSVASNVYQYGPVPLGTYMVGAVKPACSSNSITKVEAVNLISSFSNPLTSSLVGIKEMNNNAGNIAVYPNPVTDNLQIQTTLPIKEIEITDITGRLLYTTTAKTINCSSFAKGVYFIKANN